MLEMTWHDFRDKIKNNAVVVLPIGSTEAHGVHLPLGVDVITSTGFAELLAKAIGGVVAPPIFYGYKGETGGGPIYEGSLELNAKTVIDLVHDVLEELVADGVKNIFIMNGHFENEMFLLEAMDLTTREYPDVKIVESAWWDQFTDELIARVFDEVPFPGWAVEHAAIAETSMMQFFRPDLVRMERFVEEEQIPVYSYQISPIKKEVFPKLGSPSTSRSASGEKGEDIMNTILPKFVDIVTSEFSGK
jgi:Uncharacterized protein, putative amidase